MGIIYDAAPIKSLHDLRSSSVSSDNQLILLSNHILPLMFYTVSKVTYTCSPQFKAVCIMYAKGYVITISGNGQQRRLTLRINFSGISWCKNPSALTVGSLLQKITAGLDQSKGQKSLDFFLSISSPSYKQLCIPLPPPGAHPHALISGAFPNAHYKMEKKVKVRIRFS